MFADRAAERRRVDVVLAEALARQVEPRRRPAACARRRRSSAAACARARRARATCRFGLPCSAWSISAIELRRRRSAPTSRLSTVRRCACGRRQPQRGRRRACVACDAMPAMLAQPARQQGAQCGGRQRQRARGAWVQAALGHCFHPFPAGRQRLGVVENAPQVALELLPFRRAEARQVFVLHAASTCGTCSAAARPSSVSSMLTTRRSATERTRRHRPLASSRSSRRVMAPVSSWHSRASSATVLAGPAAA